ncbi:ABC transporter permease [Cohnella sp. AR92]|uniref:ABC transporter permease n=1 Tax=Cohnella sp. AR92 TaxID=648716 RepID=UPI000F8EB110|nr:ABC transporter permease [Cohnella sp. AR92]RUS45347.1 ABC transporter permease [Cohnella sp. AR92]
MWKDLLWLIRKNLNLILRNKNSWILHLALPLAGVLLSMLIYGSSNSGTLHIGIANQDSNAPLAADTVRYIEQLQKVKISLLDESKMRDGIQDGSIDSGIILSEGFSGKLQSGQSPTVDILSVKGAQVTAYVSAMLNNYLSNVAAIAQVTNGDASRFDRLYGDFVSHPYSVSAGTVKDASGKKDVTYQSIGFLLLFMLTSSYSLTELMQKERQDRTFLRMMASPVSSRTYVFSNVVVNAIVLIIQIAITLVFMKYLLGIDSGVPFGELAFILFLFALAAIGLSLLIISFSNSNGSSAALSNLIITPTCLLSGCFFPMDIMPETVRKISTFLPQHWLLDSLNKLQSGDGGSRFALNLTILIAFAAAFALIAAFRLSRKDSTQQFV